ncbi:MULTISPECIES: glycosyltransferase family 2 protein [Campylobacter]|uniref:glycosyltransferase family 2 protein n=1 Tax=Campylobacter TaxID=194 RepID=UPI000A339C39|nr:glycosyltransferase family A protein [Campylobacter sp. P0124]MCR8696911.1 glycosyltransferase family 2 protein [Campylobacter sp. RM19073]
MQDKIYLDKEFDRIWSKIENGQNFALLRYGDGERAIMCGKIVKAIEGWESPNYISKLGKDLLSTLELDDDNIFYGISCPCCDPAAYVWYLSKIKNKNITFANLWVNANYKRFKDKFATLTRDAILIANYRAKNKKIGNLNILKHYEVGDDCISFWNNKGYEMIEQIKKDFGNQDNILYIVSAGPMSEAIIAKLYENNKNNCYIDFGSCIDNFIHQKNTRSYMDENSNYAKQNCVMLKDYDVDVSVVLTAYKKPQNLRIQLDAIKKQSIKPKEILLFQDGIAQDYKIHFNDDLLKEFDIVEICDQNYGVWKRFDFARKQVKSQYVCIFDDDTIPGAKWLENCLTQMCIQEGLYGTIGIVLVNPENYPNKCNKDYFRIGWDGNLNYTAKVDFVGHSWFLKTQWLDYMFENTDTFQNFKVVGEDIALSHKLKQKGIETFVPPHSYDDQELWGSLSKYAVTLGVDSNAISVNANNISKMNLVMKEIIKDGFVSISQTDKNYISNLRKNLDKYHIRNYAKKLKPMEKVLSVKNSQYKIYKIINILGMRFKIKRV